MTSPVHHVTFSARDAYALATFWAEVVHGRLQDDDAPGDPAALVTSAGTPLLFEQVEGQSAGSRVHLDLTPRLPRAQEVERLQALGATLVADRTRPDGSGWVVLADPEGNELCIERSAAERGEPEPVDTGERRMPALHTADERTLLEGMLDWYREGVLRKVEGMRQADATGSPLRSGTTVIGLVKHLALVEDSWVTDRLAGRPMPEPWASAPFDDDPDWEFHSASDDRLEDVVALYRAACDRSRDAMSGLALDHTVGHATERPFSARFVLLHLVEETARHLGHLDLLRELADGSTGE